MLFANYQSQNITYCLKLKTNTESVCVMQQNSEKNSLSRKFISLAINF